MSSNTSSSYITAELAVTLAIVTAGIGYGYFARTQQHQAEAGSSAHSAETKGGSKKKGKKNAKGKSILGGGGGGGQSDDGAATPQVVAFPTVLSTGSSIPGGFGGAGEDVDSSDVAGSQSLSKSKKSGGKKGKKPSKPSTPGIETPRVTGPHVPNSTSTPAVQESDADGSSASAFAPLPTASQSQKKKKKSSKAKKAAAEQQQTGGHALEESTASITVDTDSSWTHVGTKKGGKAKGGVDAGSASLNPAAAPSTSSESTTGESSPVERQEDVHEGQTERRKTLAEKMIPKGRKTGVEDLLETPDYPTLSRVMRIAPPAGSKPADGYSWGDYEDVSGDAENDNDNDGSEGEWGVVKGRKSNRTTTTTDSTSTSGINRPANASVPGAQSEKLSKTQRKNQKRKAEVREAKAGLDNEQEARRAEHRRQLERQRVIEQSQKSGKAGAKVGGGMKASVENGKLVWE